MVHDGETSSPQREILLEQDSGFESFDSAYNNWSRCRQLRLEHPGGKIERSLESIQQGRVQVTLRKCLISVAFNEPLQDISQESATSVSMDEGVSMTHSLTIDWAPDLNRQPGDEIIEEGG